MLCHRVIAGCRSVGGCRLLVFLAFLGLSFGAAEAEVLTVGSSGANFTSIQEAVSYASPYDTIIILPGVYYENLLIEKPLTITAPDGAVLLPADQYLPVIHLLAVSGANLSGFTLRYAESGGTGAPGVPGMLGIYLESASGSVLSRLTVAGFPTGIILNSSSGNVLRDIKVLSSTWNSLYLGASSDNLIEGVHLNGSARAHGAVLRFSHRNTFRNLTAGDNHGYGVLLDRSSSNTFTGGLITNNTFGFFIQSSISNTIAGMRISRNYAENIRFEDSSYNTVRDSIVVESVTENGIYLNESHHNSLINLTLAYNRWNGVYVNNSIGNRVVASEIYGNNPAGVYVLRSPSTLVQASRVHGNLWRGIYVVASDGVRVENSTIYENQEGIYFEHSQNVSIVNCTLSSNLLYGIRAFSSSGATITLNTVRNTTGNAWATGVALEGVSASAVYHNAFIGNAVQASDDYGNAWDYRGGGNYWSDYDSPAEGCYDSDLNRMCDSPYTISANASDRYPYTRPYLWLGVPRISAAWADATEVAVGGVVNLSFTLENPGTSAFQGRVEGSVWLPDGSGEYLGIKSVYLLPGSSLNVTFPYTLSQGGMHDYDLYLEPADGSWRSAIDHVYVRDGFRGRGVRALEESFSSPPDWSTLRWRFAGGEYIGNSSGQAIAYLPAYHAADFNYSAEMRVYEANASLSGTAGLVFRYRDENNYYLFTAYPELSSVRLWSVVNGTWYLLNESSYSFTPGSSYTLEVSVSGSRVLARVNSVPVLSFSSLSSHPAGSVGLRVRDATAGFAWLRLQDASGVSYENFSPPLLGWCTLRWCTSSGAYGSSAPYSSLLSFSPSPVLSNMSYAARVRITNGTAWRNPTAGLVFRYRDKNNYYLFTAYPELSSVRLWSVVNGTWYLLAEGSAGISYGSWHLLRVEVAGSRVRGYVDGRYAVEFAALSSHPSGRVGVRVRDATAEYDYALAETW